MTWGRFGRVHSRRYHHDSLLSLKSYRSLLAFLEQELVLDVFRFLSNALVFCNRQKMHISALGWLYQNLVTVVNRFMLFGLIFPLTQHLFTILVAEGVRVGKINSPTHPQFKLYLQLRVILLRLSYDKVFRTTVRAFSTLCHSSFSYR